MIRKTAVAIKKLMAILLNILTLWAALNSYFLVNYGLEQVAGMGFQWLSVLEIVEITFAEWLLINVLSAALIVALRLIGRITVARLAVALAMVGLIVLGRRFSACAFAGDDSAFEALLFDQQTTPLHCLYYAVINGVMMSLKIAYFSLSFWAIRRALQRVSVNRFKAW
jgi:hypothetical protein